MKVKTGLLGLLFLGSHCAFAEERSIDVRQASALHEISEYVQTNCKSPPIEGSATEIHLNAEGDAELSKLFKKVATIQGKGNIGGRYEQYSGVNRDQLAEAMASGNQCVETLSHELFQIMIPQQATRSTDKPQNVKPAASAAYPATLQLAIRQKRKLPNGAYFVFGSFFGGGNDVKGSATVESNMWGSDDNKMVLDIGGPPVPLDENGHTVYVQATKCEECEDPANARLTLKFRRDAN